MPGEEEDKGRLILDMQGSTVKVKNLPAGIYYCDGKFDLIGPIDGDVTLIARDDIEMAISVDFRFVLSEDLSFSPSRTKLH